MLVELLEVLVDPPEELPVELVEEPPELPDELVDEVEELLVELDEVLPPPFVVAFGNVPCTVFVPPIEKPQVSPEADNSAV